MEVGEFFRKAEYLPRYHGALRAEVERLQQENEEGKSVITPDGEKKVTHNDITQNSELMKYFG